MILPLKTFLVVTGLIALACDHVFAAEPSAQSLAGVPRVTRDQMWIASPEPKYPTEAFNRRLTGRGLFYLKIRPKTYTVSQVTVLQSTGHKVLDAAAIEALSRWRGRPGELMSHVDHVRVPVTFTFAAALTPLPALSKAKALAIYAPRPQVPAEALAKHLSGAGVCVVYVRPDGVVSRAEMLQSTGQPILDKASIDAFSKWRFQPNTVKKVKIPIRYTGNYTQQNI